VIEIDEPVDGSFHRRRAAEEDSAAKMAASPIARALHCELAALHRLALRRARSADANSG
jgi:hypothetical protein